MTMHLADYMAKLSLSDERVAKAIRRSRATVSRIRRKLVRPDWGTIREMTRFSGGKITANDFADLGGRDVS